MNEAEREVMRQAVRRPEAALIVRLLQQTSGRVHTLAILHVASMDLKAPALQALQVMTTLTLTMTLTLTLTEFYEVSEIMPIWYAIKLFQIFEVVPVHTLTSRAPILLYISSYIFL